MTTEEIKTLFARRSENFSRLDAAALAADYAKDCVVESPTAGVHTGPEAAERGLRAIFAAFPDLRMHPEELLICDDRVMETVTVSGIDNGGFMGFPPTGRPFSVTAVFSYVLKDQQIVQERRIYDFGRLLFQIAGDAEPVVEAPRLYRKMLETAQLEHELKIAAEIQRALLPELQHKGVGFDVAAASLPCRAIGGDFFDYFDLPNGVFAFALGDVAGKGPPAALLAAELQGILATHSYSTVTAADTVTRVNQVLARRRIESRFVTMLYGVLARDGRLTYCNAGHNPPFLIGQRGTRRLDKGGLILGAFKEAEFQEETIQLHPGDLLVVFSDGVTEALNAEGTEFGEERLLCCAKTNRELTPTAFLERLLDMVRDFSIGAAQSDDLTALVLRYVGTQT